jgi:hypothetical protein
MITLERLVWMLLMAGSYAAAAVSIALCLYRHRALKLESKKAAEALEQRTQQAEQKVEATEAVLSVLRAQLAGLEEQVQLSSGTPAKSWTNINRRTQALRMLRSGDKSDRVASELSMSKGEVELIRRVHTIAASSYDPTIGFPGGSEKPSNLSIGG